jgi:signal peptidase I
MNEFPSQSRRTAGGRSASDDLGEVPEGYSYAPQPQQTASWQGSGIPEPNVVNVLPDSEPTTKSGNTGKTAGRALREIVETILLAAIIFFGVRLLVLNFKVDGQSMMPNLHDQELLLVNRNAYSDIDLNSILNRIPGVDRDGTWIIWEFSPPERGDIIVFNPPNGDDKPYIKRVIATEGETVEIREGSVFVNGTELEEPYIREGITDCNRSEENCTWVVPEGNVFALGDNRRNSSDSRVFGPVPIESIIGKAIVTYWPASDIGLVPHYDYPEISE